MGAPAQNLRKHQSDVFQRILQRRVTTIEEAKHQEEVTSSSSASLPCPMPLLTSGLG
jgi:hypothetical protein